MPHELVAEDQARRGSREECEKEMDLVRRSWASMVPVAGGGGMRWGARSLSITGEGRCFNLPRCHEQLIWSEKMDL